MNKELALKLYKFQQIVQPLTKDLINPYFKSQYFNVDKVIEIIKPILDKVGLITNQPPVIIDGKNALKTYVTDVDTGETLEGEMLLPESKTQEIGSSLTYLRRYMLVSMLLLQGENDDDGNQASKPVYKAPPAKNSNLNNEESPF